MAFCRQCGQEISKDAFVCIHCGVLTADKPNPQVTKQNNGVTLGIIGLCFALILPPVTWICSGIGLSNAVKAKHDTGKILNIIALSISALLFVF